MRKPDKRTEANTKICKDCGKKLTLSKFYKTSYAQKHGTNSRMPYCIKCYSIRGKTYYAANSEVMNAKSKASALRRKTADPIGFREARVNTYLKNTYGINLQEWKNLHTKQRGRCAICLNPITVKMKGQQDCGVDHDHACCPGVQSCGKCVRALLCLKCNRGIGQFDENITTLKRAIKYLEQWRLDHPITLETGS